MSVTAERLCDDCGTAQAQHLHETPERAFCDQCEARRLLRSDLLDAMFSAGLSQDSLAACAAEAGHELDAARINALLYPETDTPEMSLSELAALCDCLDGWSLDEETSGKYGLGKDFALHQAISAYMRSTMAVVEVNSQNRADWKRLRAAVDSAEPATVRAALSAVGLGDRYDDDVIEAMARYLSGSRGWPPSYNPTTREWEA